MRVRRRRGIGYGACGCFACSECGFESLAVLITEDVRDGEHGPRAYRPCALCRAAVTAASALRGM